MTEKKFINLKDLILCVALSCLVLLVALMLIAPLAPLGLLVSSLVSISITAIVGGIAYVLITTKSGKIGTHFVFSFVFAIFFIISGTMTTAIIIIIGGLLGELIMINGWGRKWRPVIPYIVHWLFYSYALTFQLIFMKEKVISTYMSMGMDEATAKATMDSIAAVYTAPTSILLAGVCAILAGFIGYYIGIKALHKHFKAAGVA